MNIKKENIPVLVAPNAYVGTWNNQCIFSVYLEKNAFWKISHVGDNDMVIYTTGDNWNPKVVTGYQYHQMTIQHNNQLLAEMSPLDDGERKYLKGVINPIRDEVKFITKSVDGQCEYISISFKTDGWLVYPDFEKGKMYKGMKLGKNYTIKELGL